MGKDREQFRKDCDMVKGYVKFVDTMVSRFEQNAANKQSYNLGKGKILSAEENEARIIRNFYDTRKEAVQAALESFLDGSGNCRDKDKVLNWITQNKDAFAVLDNDTLAKYVKDDDYLQMRKDTAEIRKIVNSWLELYDKYGDILLNEDGSLKDLDDARPGTKEAEAKEARDNVLYSFTVYEKTVQVNKDAEKASRENYEAFLNSINSTKPEELKYNPIQVLLTINKIVELYPDRKDMLISCKNAAEKITPIANTDKFFERFVTESKGYGMMKNILKKGSDAVYEQNSLNRKAAFEEKLNRTEKYRTRLAEFARALKNASRHDKQDYKDLISMVSGFTDKNAYGFVADGKIIPEAAKLTDAQREALPLYMIHEKINAYLEHKAKDGVNRNAYEKLAAVEELNQFVSRQIHDLKVADIQYNGTTYKLSDVHVSYKDELAAERTRLTEPDVIENIMKSNNITKEKGIKDPNPADILIDTSIDDNNLAANSKLPAKSRSLSVLKNASSCMDRIMLKVQKDPKIMAGTIKTLASGNIPAKVAPDMFDLRNSFVKDPVKLMDVPVRQDSGVPRV